MKLSLIVSSARILLSCVPSAFSIEVSVQRTFVWPVSLCAFLQVDSIVVVFEAPHLYCLTLESIAPTRSFVSCSFYSFAIFCLWPWMCHPVYLVEWIQHQSWLSCRRRQWRAGEVLCHLDQNLQQIHWWCHVYISCSDWSWSEEEEVSASSIVCTTAVSLILILAECFTSFVLSVNHALLSIIFLGRTNDREPEIHITKPHPRPAIG